MNSAQLEAENDNHQQSCNTVVNLLADELDVKARPPSAQPSSPPEREPTSSRREAALKAMYYWILSRS
jgi:hypothetical protein